MAPVYVHGALFTFFDYFLVNYVSTDRLDGLHWAIASAAAVVTRKERERVSVRAGKKAKFLEKKFLGF